MTFQRETAIDREAGQFVVYAPNVHQGGGRSLLLPIFEALQADPGVLFVVDERLQLPAGSPDGCSIIRVAPTLMSRLAFEWRFRALLKRRARLLCMGNLPPLWAHCGRQIVFVQNRYLVEPLFLGHFPWPIRLRIRMERWWLRSRARYVDSFVVQGLTMQRLLKETLGFTAQVLPFVAHGATKPAQDDAKRPVYDFLYVASGEGHKNHHRLVEAWVLLANRGLFPSLCLTLDSKRFPELCRWIAQASEAYSLNISLVGERAYPDIVRLYHQSKALIYPSVLESFGLPIIEAIQAGLPVLAARRDYVFDLIDTTETFDAESVESIADAVASFSFLPAKLKVELLDVNTFLQRTLFHV